MKTSIGDAHPRSHGEAYDGIGSSRWQGEPTADSGFTGVTTSKCRASDNTSYPSNTVHAAYAFLLSLVALTYPLVPALLTGSANHEAPRLSHWPRTPRSGRFLLALHQYRHTHDRSHPPRQQSPELVGGSLYIATEEVFDECETERCHLFLSRPVTLQRRAAHATALGYYPSRPNTVLAPCY